MKMILFDFDGVLVDTLSICFTLNKEVEEDLSLEDYKSFFHGNIYHAIEAGNKKIVPNFEERYRVETREIKIPNELKSIVVNLASKHTLTIVSSTPTQAIKNILKREKIDQYFTDVLGADVHKNKVIKINMLLDKHQVKPEEVVFITDTVGDIKEGRECGVQSIAVSWGFHDAETLEKAQPFRVAHTPEELLKAIEEITHE